MIGAKFDFGKLWAIVCKYKYVAVVLVVGFILLIVPGKGALEKQSEDAKDVTFSVRELEEEIKAALSQCDGVGRVDVVLSVESGPESIYAKEAKQSVREKESGVVTESDSDMRPSIMSEGSGKERPIVIKEMYPQFRGAMIICDGADVPSVRSSVIGAVSALTGLRSDRISVVKMKV